MRDPFSWSFPIGSLFGITIRIHVLFPVVAIGLILRFYFPSAKDAYVAGTWIDVAQLVFIAFVVVLLHEFGHSFAARRLNGSADEILIWPLGGLAQVELPHTPRAHFLVAAAGPAVNFVICFILTGFFLFAHDPSLRPLVNPLEAPFRVAESGAIQLYTWSGEKAPLTTSLVWIFLARMFWVSWVLMLFNLVLVGFPMDSGRMFQAVLWHYVGYRQAMIWAVYVGFFFMLVLGVASIAWDSMLLLALAIFVGVSCQRQYILLESGGDESLFGYDFSQGYTSLERDAPNPAPRVRRPNWFQRWRDRRAAQKLQRELEQRDAEERRLDELLQRVQDGGLSALTEEERRFLKRVSDRYKNRN